MSKKEIWKDIEGYEGLYMISNSGYVKSFKNVKNLILKNSILNVGYKVVTLHKNGIATMKLIHRLIGIAFIPNPNNYRQINHKDGVKLNNNIENLEWVTPSQNIKHAYDIGLMTPKKSEDCFSVKLTRDQVNEIRSLNITETLLVVAKRYNITSTNLRMILDYRIWK